jgi:hypothetical protein
MIYLGRGLSLIFPTGKERIFIQSSDGTARLGMKAVALPAALHL